MSILLLSDVGECRIEIGDYVIRILRSDGEPDEIFVHSAVVELLRGERAGVVIPWENICKIGDDVILVDVEL